MQTDAKLLVSNTQHCRAQHVASVCMEPQQRWHLLALVAYSLKSVKLLGPCKRTQRHCWPKTTKNAQQCCDLLRPFAWAFKAFRLQDFLGEHMPPEPPTGSQKLPRLPLKYSRFQLA